MLPQNYHIICIEHFTPLRIMGKLSKHVPPNFLELIRFHSSKKFYIHLQIPFCIVILYLRPCIVDIQWMGIFDFLANWRGSVHPILPYSSQVSDHKSHQLILWQYHGQHQRAEGIKECHNFFVHCKCNSFKNHFFSIFIFQLSDALFQSTHASL